jgi:ribonuclease HI
LIKIDYSESAGAVILGVDASLEGYGAVLMQEDDNKKRRAARYESGTWNTAEKNYDATKRECRGVLRALKKFRHWLYGIHFILETDARVLVAQLNGAASDLPGALLTRWIAWIRLFDFDVRHVPGRKHTAADGLSRRPRTFADKENKKLEQDIDDFINAELASLRIVPILVALTEPPENIDEEQDYDDGVLSGYYSVRSRKIALWLTKLQRLDMRKEEFRKFKNTVLKFLVQDKHLFRRGSKNIPLRRVVDSKEEQA